MLQQLWTLSSMGERYLLSSAVYLGLGLILTGSLPDRSAIAQTGCDGVTCPDGQQCCGGQCIASDYVCCQDGTSGPSDSCICCTGCDGSLCTNVSTVECQSP